MPFFGFPLVVATSPFALLRMEKDGIPTIGLYAARMFLGSDLVSIDHYCSNTLPSRGFPSEPGRGAHAGTLFAFICSVVFSIIRLFPQPRQRPQLLEILRSVRDLTRPSLGCVGCWVSEEDHMHSYIRYAEQWESEEALNEHIRSDLYRRVLAAMELSKRPPEISFHFTSETKGFELIENVRRQSKSSPGPLGLQGAATSN